MYKADQYSNILWYTVIYCAWSPIHTARWSWKIARKLPECLLCEHKHVPGLIPGLIRGWDLVTLPGSVPERALCEQKPDQCRKWCVIVMMHFIVRQFYRVFWRQINVHTMKNMETGMKQWSGSSSLSALKLKSFSSLVKWWARIIHVTWNVTCLYGLCVNARTDSGKSLAVWMQQIWRSGNKCWNTLPVYFPESLCERGFRLIQNQLSCLCTFVFGYVW